MLEEKTNAGINIKAILSAISAFLFLSFVSILMKLQEQGGAKLEWIIFVQYASFLFIITIVAAKRKFRDLKTGKIKLHIIRGIAGILAVSCLVISMSKIPLVNAVLLNNTAPIFIPIITLIWLKTKINGKIWYGILIGFAGIVFILQPSSKALLKQGDAYGLVSGIFLAIVYVAIKILTRTDSFTSILFYYSLIAFIISAPFAVISWSNQPPVLWIYGILTGASFMCYLYLIQYAYRFAEPIKISPLNYLVIVFTGIFDWVLYNNIPDVLSIFGMILVSAGGILAITLHEKNNNNLKHHWH